MTSPERPAAAPRTGDAVPSPCRVRALRWFARGRCLVEDEAGRTFLAEGAIPGEELTVAFVETPRGALAQVRTVHVPSPRREDGACAHALRCTGCNLLHVTRDEERAVKALTVREVLLRWADVAWEAPIPVLTAHERGGHRVRHRVHARVRAGHVETGLFDARGHIVDAPDCPAAHPRVRAALDHVRWALRHEPGPLEAAVEVRLGADGCAVVLHGFDRAASTRVAERVATRDPHLTVAATSGDEAPTLLRGTWPAQRSVDGRPLADAVDAWLQPAPTHAAPLYDWVESRIPPGGRLLDATCGTGGLALRLAERQREVLGVDAAWDAVQSAQRTAELRGLTNATFRGGRIQTVAPRMVAAGETFDAVLINPMRVSLGPEAMAALATLARQRIVYLGPAPRAAADDLRHLLDRGWSLREVVAADLHPGTAAVMACFVAEPPAPT